jgi:hypothetical protein
LSSFAIFSPTSAAVPAASELNYSPFLHAIPAANAFSARLPASSGRSAPLHPVALPHLPFFTLFYHHRSSTRLSQETTSTPLYRPSLNCMLAVQTRTRFGFHFVRKEDRLLQLSGGRRGIDFTLIESTLYLFVCLFGRRTTVPTALHLAPCRFLLDSEGPVYQSESRHCLVTSLLPKRESPECWNGGAVGSNSNHRRSSPQELGGAGSPPELAAWELGAGSLPPPPISTPLPRPF